LGPGEAPESWTESQKLALRAEQQRFLGTATPDDAKSFDHSKAVERAERCHTILEVCLLMAIEIGPRDQELAAAFDAMSTDEIRAHGAHVHRVMGIELIHSFFAEDGPLHGVDVDDLMKDVETASSVPSELRSPLGIPDRLRVILTALDQGYITRDELRAIASGGEVTVPRIDELDDPVRDARLSKLRDSWTPFSGQTVSLNDLFAGVEDEKPN